MKREMRKNKKKAKKSKNKAKEKKRKRERRNRANTICSTSANFDFALREIRDELQTLHLENKLFQFQFEWRTENAENNNVNDADLCLAEELSAIGKLGMSEGVQRKLRCSTNWLMTLNQLGNLEQ